MKRTPPPGILNSTHPDWPILWPVEQAIVGSFGGREAMGDFMAEMLRNVIDSVIDTPATGRKAFGELEKTEKTYLGTKVEIVLRRRMGFPKGKLMDLNIGGTETDIKFTTSGSWMIPPEALDQVLLLIAADDIRGRFWMGLVVADAPKLRGGSNRDAKTSLSAAGWQHIRWLIRDRAYEPNFWLGVPQHLIDHICDPSVGGTERMFRLFRSLPRKPIPRSVVADVAQQRDFTRRVRANGGARDLTNTQWEILSDPMGQDAVAALGLPRLPKGGYMCIDVQDARERKIIEESNLKRTQKEWAAKRAPPKGKKVQIVGDDILIEPAAGYGRFGKK